MNKATDLHPGDAATRLRIRTQLTAARRAHRWSHRDAGQRLNVGPAAIYQMERRDTWSLPVLQRWARAVGYRVEFTLDGLPAVAIPFGSVTSRDPHRADEWARANLIDTYRATREALGLTQVDVASRLGCNARAVGQFEDRVGVVMLPTLQRNVRALGGALHVTLHQVQAPIWESGPVPADHPDDAAARDQVRLQLIAARTDAGWTLQDLAGRAGRARASVGAMERRTTWGVEHLIGWARHVGRVVVLSPTGLPDVAPAPLRCAPSTQAEADRLVVADVARHLTEARRALGWNQSDLADRLGCRSGVVATWEQRGGAGTELWALQRRTRALGGVLHVDLEPARTAVGVSAA